MVEGLGTVSVVSPEKFYWRLGDGTVVYGLMVMVMGGARQANRRGGSV